MTSKHKAPITLVEVVVEPTVLPLDTVRNRQLQANKYIPLVQKDLCHGWAGRQEDAGHT